MRLKILIILIWSALVIGPPIIAFQQLDFIAERNVFETIMDFDNRFQTQGSMQFTFLIASYSTILTLILGVPLAWNLGRYKWKYSNLLRSIFTVPFVMPSILVAMGFLSLLDWFELYLGINDSQQLRLYALLFSHAWFNLALVIRFCEPILSTIDSSYEESASLLPKGNTKFRRLKNLWWPLLWPNIIASASLIFIFSFTSFALVKFLIPSKRNLEVVMSNQAEWAGVDIPALGRVPSEIILASSSIQLAVIIIALAISSKLQSKSFSHHISSLDDKRIEKSFFSIRGIYILIMLILIILPLLSLISSSFFIRNGDEMAWSTRGWSAAFGGTHSPTNMYQAVFSSIKYAIITVLIALPIGFILSDTINELERSGNTTYAIILDVIVMLPLALSAVMVGLGVLVGIIRTDPEIVRSWWIPIYGHLMLTTPFVVRVLLPAFRNLNPDYEMSAALLGAGHLERIYKIKIPMLIPSILVSSSLVFAISLGEFGASWVVLRFTEFTTLPVMIGDILSRPGFDPVVRSAANSAGTVLLLMTLILFMCVERFRPVGGGGEF